MDLWKAIACALALVPAAGCQEKLVCGEKTRAENGRCVASFVARCGEGTVQQGDDCVPAHPLTCAEGTEEQDGQCVPILECGTGTVEKNHRCELVDPLQRVTVGEGAEPNMPPGPLKRFTLPDIGAAPVVLGGTIGLVADGQADMDGFVFAGAPGQRIRLSALAVGAPAVAVAVQPVDRNLSFPRFSLSLTSRHTAREIELPAAGDWLVIVTELNNLVQEALPMGSPTFSYTVDVERLAPPAAGTLVGGAAVRGELLRLDRWTFTAGATMPLLDVLFTSPADPFPGIRALWATGAGDALLLNVADTVEWGVIEEIPPTRMAVPAGAVTFVADYQYRLDPAGESAAPYELTVTPVTVLPLAPTAEGQNAAGSLAGDGNDVYAFDAPANSLLSVSMGMQADTQIAPLLELRDADYALVASDKTGVLRWFLDEEAAGRYYLVVRDRTWTTSKSKLDYQIVAALKPVTPLGPVAAGSSATLTATLAAGQSAWFAAYAGNDATLQVTVQPPAGMDAHAHAWPPHLRRVIADSAGGGAGALETLPAQLVPVGGAVLVEVTGDVAGDVVLEAAATETRSIFEQEPNGDAAHANDLTLDGAGHAAAAGFLHDGVDRDYFRFTVPGTTPMRVAIETVRGIWGGKMDSVLQVQDGNGSLVAYNDDHAGSLLSLATVTLQPGTYYVVLYKFVVSSAEYDGADYILTVDVTPP